MRASGCLFEATSRTKHFELLISGRSRYSLYDRGDTTINWLHPPRTFWGIIFDYRRQSDLDMLSHFDPDSDNAGLLYRGAWILKASSLFWNNGIHIIAVFNGATEPEPPHPLADIGW